MRAEGGFWSAAFDVATNRFIAVSCNGCGYTELYRADVGTDAKLFDFLTTWAGRCEPAARTRARAAVVSATAAGGPAIRAR